MLDLRARWNSEVSSTRSAGLYSSTLSIPPLVPRASAAKDQRRKNIPEGRAPIRPRKGLQAQRVRDHFQRLGAETVGSHADDEAVTHLEAMDFVQSFNAIECPEAQH